MKKVLLKIFTFVLALCCVGLVACDNTVEKPAATLVGFENSSLEISYGGNYNIAEYVYDSEGNRYEVTATVTDSDNQKVEADKVLQVVKASYKVVYSLEFAGETVTKTVSIKALSTPVLEFAGYKEQTYTVGILPVELPAISASDVIDGTITNITKEVYRQTSFEITKMEDYDGVSNYYIPQKPGTYFWKITATNSAGNSNSRTLYFYITENTGVYDLLVYEGGETVYKTTRTGTTIEYVKAEDIPTTVTLKAGTAEETTKKIGNDIGYNKDAYRFTSVPNDTIIEATFGYTANEYLALESQGKFNAVEFSYMVYNPLEMTVRNNDQTTNDSRTFLSANGHYMDDSQTPKYDKRKLTTNQWHYVVAPIDEFVKTLGTGKVGKAFRSFMYQEPVEKTIDFYISDVKFIEHDWNSVTFKGAYGIIIDDGNYSKITAATKDGKATADATVSYAAAADMPIAYSYNTKEGGVTTGAVANTVGYTGNAAKVSIGANGRYVSATFNYTAEEFSRLEQEGKFNAVKITIMSESGTNNNTTNMLAQAGLKSLPRGAWKNYVISIADFVETFSKPDSNKANIYQSWLTNGGDHDLYIGNIEFITYDFAHSHAGGDATKCNLLPICDTCQLPYEPADGIPAHISDGTESCIALPKCSVCGLNFGTFAGHTGGTATCTKQAECTTCGEGYGELAAHTGGTATDCKTQAACEVCGQSYGEYGPHIEKVDEANPGTLPTGDTPGVAAVSSCEICGTPMSSGETLPAMNLVATEENLTKVSDTRETHIAKEFVLNGAIPSEGIINNVGFSGDAFKMVVDHDVDIFLRMPYTGEEYAKLASKGAFNAVKFSYMVQPTVEVPSLTNNSTDTFFNMFGFAGYNGNKGTRLAQNRWVTHVISADDFVSSFEDATNNKVSFFKSYTDVGDKSVCNFFFGDIQFINYVEHEHTGGEETCFLRPVCDICSQEYGALASHNPVVDETQPGTLPTGTEVGYSAKSICSDCGTVLSNGEELPAMNFVPSSTDDVAKTYAQGLEMEYVANDNLPTKDVPYGNYNTTVDSTTQYTGNAIKMKGSYDMYYYVQLPYTPDEYKDLASKGAFDTIKFYFLVEDGGLTYLRNHSHRPAANSNPDYADHPEYTGTWTMLSGAGYYTNKLVSNEPKLPLDGWICAEIDVDALCDSYTKDGYCIIRTRNDPKKAEFNLYIGNVEFVKVNN